MLYWHWLALGLLLILAELFIPSFTIFWFGLGALLVGGLLLLGDFSLSWQLFAWAISSSLFTFLWFRFLKPRMTDRTKAGMSREAILGEIGLVILLPEEERRGVVRFAKPLLGSDEWPFICEQPVSVGDRVSVKDVSGNTLVVERLKLSSHLAPLDNIAPSNCGEFVDDCLADPLCEHYRQKSIEAVKALDGKTLAMLDEKEKAVLDFYRVQGRKFGIRVEIINQADPVALAKARSRQEADAILMDANSIIRISVGQ